MKLISEYLEQAIRFERMAEESIDPKLKEGLLQQAAAYHKLAERRAKGLNIPVSKRPPDRSEARVECWPDSLLSTRALTVTAGPP